MAKKGGIRMWKNKNAILWAFVGLVVLMLFVFSDKAYNFDMPGAVYTSGGEKYQQCPEYGMTKSCFVCHVASDFRLRETNPHDAYNYPQGFKFALDDNGKPLYGRYVLKDVDSDSVKDVFDYCRRHKIKRIVMELFSPGGGLLEAWRIVGMMSCWRAEGGTIETRVHGFAASAGFIVFIAGDIGKRFTQPTAELMFHELWTIKWPSVETPSSKEEEAKVYRHLQDTACAFLASRTNLSKEDWDKKIRFKELWANGTQAVKMGIADGFISDSIKDKK